MDMATDTTTAPTATHRSRRSSRAEATYSLYAPALLIAIAFFSWTAFQTWNLMGERAVLKQAVASQEQLVVNSAKLRKSLDGMASETRKLADQGNPNARMLVDELRKRGVNIAAPDAKP